MLLESTWARAEVVDTCLVGLIGAGQVKSQDGSFPELELQQTWNIPARISPAV